MKLWIECANDKSGNRYYYVWKVAPHWEEDTESWTGGEDDCRCLCSVYMEFLFGDSFDSLLPGELMELDVKHAETWVMR